MLSRFFSRSRPDSRAGQGRRKGAIMVLAAILMILMMGMLAFSIDVGYILVTRNQMQRAVDSAALAGVGVLASGEDLAQAKAVEYLVRNPIGGETAFDEELLAAEIAKFKAQHANDYVIKTGNWEPNQQDSLTGSKGTVVASDGPPSAVQVYYELQDNPLFFGQFLGKDSFTTQASAVAVYQPRDIMVVIDLSGSMNDDTEFQAISTLGKQHVEDNLRQCYADLGSPVYGNGTFPLNPGWPKVPGVDPANSNLPKIHVEYRHTEVYVTSTKPLQKVVLDLSNGTQKTFNSLSGTSGTFSSGSSSKWIKKAWVRSGSNSTNGEEFDFSTDSAARTAIRKAYGWTNVAFPSQGSWDDYINWCRDSDSTNADAGYLNKFGSMSLMAYLLENKESSTQSPNLYKVSAQPITSVKDGVDVFVNYIDAAQSEDRIGLAVYNSSTGDGKLEQGLTDNLSVIKSLSRSKQAGHYTSYTNIAGGMAKGRQELVSNARTGAYKMMVLLTDGVANYYNGSYNTTTAKNAVVNEANLAKAAKLRIVTISLGAGADVALMQQVADITKGYHFNIPGGESVAAYQAALLEAFKDIATDRPLRIVK